MLLQNRNFLQNLNLNVVLGPAMPRRDEDGNFIEEDSDSDDGAGPLPEG